MKHWQDRRLVRQVLGGDRRAAERLVAERYTSVYRFLLFHTRSPVLADDLTQQTFVRAWQALASYEGRAALATWLQQIAYNEWRGWLRSRKEHVPLENAGEMPDERTDGALERVLFDQLLAELPGDLREVCVLFHVQRLTVDEIAVLLDLAPGTVKSRIVAARRRLRGLLAEPKEASYEELSSRRPGFQRS